MWIPIICQCGCRKKIKGYRLFIDNRDYARSGFVVPVN